MNWLLVAILAGLLSNGVHFTSRYMLRDSDDPMAIGWFQSLFRMVFFAIWAFFNFHIQMDLKSILLLAGLGLAEVFSTYTYIKMHATAHLSLSSIVTRTRLFWVPVMAFLLFGEKLLLHEYLGIVVLFVGLAVVSSPKKIVADQGLRFAYMFGLAAALVNISLKANHGIASIPVMMVIMSGSPVIALPILMKKGFSRIASSLKVQFGMKLLNGLFGALSIYALTYAIEIGPVSKVSAIQQGMLIVSVLAGIIFLKERENVSKKIIGSLITLVGVYLLTAMG